MQESADLVTFTEEILNGKLHFLCSVRTQGILRTLSNIYDREFYSEQCVTIAFFKRWHIQNPRHIQNIVKHQS